MRGRSSRGSKNQSQFFLNNFIYLSLAVLGLRCSVGFSLVAVIRGYSLVVVQRFLIVVISLIEEHGL